MRLSSVRSGQNCKIIKFNNSAELKNKFSKLGLVEGTTVRVIRKAIFNGPIEILIRSYCLAIRYNDASQIIVEV